MKQINTLVTDIYQLMGRRDGWFTGAIADSLSTNIAVSLQYQLGERVGRPTLRLSQMGPRCPRSLWYSIHKPEMAEALPPWAEIKYSFGHILEALIIALAKAAGHQVEGEQDELVLDDIVGHRDCVIDGCVVDVKSSSSRGFVKFKNKTLWQDDSFGYLDQLDGYVTASADDPLVRVKDKGYILAVDKQLGHLALYEHIIRSDSIKQRIVRSKEIVGLGEPPLCDCETVADGKSGNIKLGIKASYNPYKRCCFPNLRTFAYSNGPVDLVKVVRLPDVPEIRPKEKVVYH